jgi:hypothetical protein
MKEWFEGREICPLKSPAGINRASPGTAVEHAAGAIADSHTSGTAQCASPALRAMTGYTSKEAARQNPRAFERMEATGLPKTL